MKPLAWSAVVFALLAVFLQSACAQTTDATKSIGTPVATITAGVATTFTITAKDESGSLRTSGGDAFNVELEGTRSITGSVVDQLSGQYTVSYTATQGGSYEAAVKLAQAGGLTAAYYENVWFFYTPVVVTVDPQINFNWGTGLITPTGADYISIRWSGKLKTLYAEAYTFYTSTDDGVRLWVDNVPLIDRWDSYTNDTSATIALKANVFYAIKMEYKELTGNAYATLSWSSPSTPKEIVPASQLYYETHAVSSPFSTQVVPASTCAVTSVASGDGLAKATAGTASQFTIQANDEYSNERLVGGDTFSVRCYPPSTETIRPRAVHAVVVDDTDSTYAVEYTPYVSTGNTVYAELLKAGGFTATTYTIGDGSSITGINPNLGAVTKTGVATTVAPTSSNMVFASSGAMQLRVLRGFLKPTSDGLATFTLTTTPVGTAVTHNLVVDGKALSNTGYTSSNIVGILDLRSSNFYEIVISIISPSGSTSSSATLAVTVSGAAMGLTVSNSYEGFHILGSPFAVTVSPARTSAAQSQAYISSLPDSLLKATAGAISQFTITARDLYTNLRAVGGEAFKVRLTGVDSTAGYVYDNGDGTYRVTYTTSKSGTYDISVVFGSSGVIGSPFRIAVQPAFRHLPASIVTGTALTLATAGIYAHVTLTIKDAFDNWQPNPSIMSDSIVGFSLTDGTKMTSQVPGNTVATSSLCTNLAAPFGAGDCPKFASGVLVAIPTTADKPTMVMHYVITKSGVYSMKISGSGLNDGSVRNSPFPATVFPHIPCASTSTAAGSALSLVTAGSAAAFTVQARDMWYNRRGSQVGDNYAAFFRAPGQASAMNTVYVTTTGSSGGFVIATSPNLRGGGAITPTPNDDPRQWTYSDKVPFAVGDAVTFSGTLPSPLVAGQVYFVKTVTSTAFTIFDAHQDAFLAVVASTVGITFTAKTYELTSPLKQNSLLGRDHRATVTDNGDSTYSLQFMPTQSETNQLHSYLGYKGGLMATYYTNQVGPINDGATANVQEVLANPGLGATSALSAKNRLRFNGLIRPSNTGTYSFRISGATASTTKLSFLAIDNMIIATATGITGIIDLSSNSYYDILIDLLLNTAANAAVTMSLEYSPATSGSWASMPTDRMYVAFHTLGSPFAVAVAPAPTCASASTKEAQSISLSTAGQIASFTMQARDQYGLAKSSSTVAAGWLGNLRDGSGDAFDFALMSGATVPAVGLSASYYPSQDSSKDAGFVAFQGNVTYSNLNKQPGGYQVQYLATAGGMYQLRGKLMQVGGLYAEYFENNDLTDNGVPATAAFNRIDPTINFSWLDQAPASAAELAASAKKIGADYFSARWLGMVRPQFSEVHTFSLVADDGVKLWVDGLLIINFWSRRNLEAEGTVALMGGQLYNIKLEYTEMNGNATCILKWRSASQIYEVISSSRLYYSTTSGRLSRTQLYVEPSVVCASTSLAAGPGLTIATAGIKAKFTIQSFDEYGNMRKMGDSPDFKVRIVPISDASQRPYHANLNHRWSTSGIERIPSAGTFSGGLTATYYDTYCLGSLSGTAASSCDLLWDKIHTNAVIKFVTCMQRPWDLQDDQIWVASSGTSVSSLVLKNANQAICGFGMGGSHTPYLSWNSGVEIVAQKMNPDYTSSSVELRETLFPNPANPGPATKPAFSVRWSGYFQPSLSGQYTFQIVTATAASVRLVLNAIGAPKQIITTATSGVAGGSASIGLISNALYEIEMSYSPNADLLVAPSLNLQYQIPGSTTWSDADKRRLFPLAGRYRTDYTPTVKAEYSVQVGVAHPGALDATFYSDVDLSTPSATLKHATVDFSSAPYFDNTRPRNSLDVGFGATGLDDGNSFSARWQGFYLANTMVSTFTVTVGGPDERVRLWIDNRLIIDRWDTFTDVQTFTNSWTAAYDVSVAVKTAGEKEALVTAVVTSGAITALNPVNFGAGYSMVPKLSTSGCTSSSTTLAELVVVAIDGNGAITSVQIVGGGANYICTPSIQISGGRDFVWSSSANSLLDIKLEYKQLGAAASIRLNANNALVTSTSLFMNREIWGSPFPPMSVQPAPTCATKSSVRGQGLTSATAGMPSMFTIQSNDQYFNERGLGGDLYLVRLQVGGTAFGCQEIGTCPIVYGTVIDNGDSSYSVTYNITRRGTYNVVTSLAVPGGLTATYYTYAADFSGALLPLGAGNSQPPDMTLWQADTGNMIASKTANYGIRLEGFVSPPASTVTFTFSRGADMTVRRMWFNTHMGARSETPAAGHGCWFGAPASSAGVYNLPTCTNDYNGPTIATVFVNNGITVSNLVINALYDIKIELGHADNTGMAVQWKYGTGVTAAAANIPSSRLWARYDVPNGNSVQTGHTSLDLVTFSTATAAIPNPWHFYLANTLFVEQTDPATCTVTGDGLTIVTAGWTASFTITAKDSFANERFLSEDVFLVQMVSPANDVATLRAVPDTRPVKFPATSSSAVSISAYAAGTITASASSLTDVATGTPVTFATDGAPSSAFKSGVTYFVERTPVAGVADTFTVSAYPGGPPITTGTYVATTATFQFARQGAGRYSVAFSVTASGYYSVNVLRGMTSGLTAQYFNNMWLLGTPALSTVDPSVNFNWGASTIQPAQGSGSVVLGSDYMSVRWSGYIMPELAETYTFYASADEGMRLRVDNKLLIDQWDSASSNYSATWYGGSVGALYSISFEYRESTLSAFAFLEYATASIARQVIPQEVLFSKAQHVYGSPFKLYALPAILCATTSTLTGPGLSFGTTGNTASFTIQARDQYSNPKTFWHETCTFTGYSKDTVDQLTAVATSGRLVVGSKFTQGAVRTVTALGSCAAGNICSYTISPATPAVSCTQDSPCTASDQDNAFFVARTRDATLVSSWTQSGVNADYGKFATIVHNNVPGKFNSIFTATKMGSSAVYTSYMNLVAASGLMATYYKANLPVSTAKIATLSDDLSAGGKWAATTDGWAVRYSGIMFATVAGWYSFGINQAVACSGSDLTRILMINNKIVLSDTCPNSLAVQPTSSSTPVQANVANTLFDVVFTMSVPVLKTAFLPGVVSISAQTSVAAATIGAVVSTSIPYPIYCEFPVSRSPYNVTVRPDVTSYAISTITGLALTIATAGVTSQYTITSKDAAGNIRDSQGDTYLVYAASATGASFAGTIGYLSGGLYVVQYTPTVQGAYVLKTYLGTADKTTALTVYPGAACASLSLANSKYLSVSTAGYISEFSVQCKDSYNNLRTVAVDKWIVRVKGNSSTNSEEQHDARVAVASLSGGSQVYQLGRYNALYRTTKSGAFAVNVMLVSTQGLNATYYRDLLYSNIAYNAIEINTASFSMTSWGLGTPNSQVGVVDNWSAVWSGYLLQNLAASNVFVTFKMLVQTSTDKARLWIDDRFIIDQNTATNPSASLLLNTNMMYDIKVYYANPSGNAGVEVQWSAGAGSWSAISSSNLFAAASHVKGSPFSATVFPALTCGTRSIGSGDGLSLATAGIAASFTITAFDHLGNVRTTSDDIFVVRARANLHNNKQAIDNVNLAETPTFGIDAFIACNPTITLGLSSNAVTMTPSASSTFLGCKAVTVTMSGGTCTSVPKIIPLYTTLGVLSGFQLENAGYCTVAPAATVAVAADILGTVISLGNGLYSASYIPTLKRNDAVTFHDLAVSQALAGGLMATYYTGALDYPNRVKDHVRSNQTVFQTGTLIAASTAPNNIYSAVTPTTTRAMGFFKPLVSTCTFTLAGSALNAQIIGKQYTSTVTLTGLEINKLYDIRFELTGTSFVADTACIPALDVSSRYFALHDLAFNTFRGDGLYATYYTPTPQTGTTTSAIYIQDANLDWSGVSRTDRPYPAIPYDTASTGGAFAARWFGFVKPSRRDRYTFFIQARNPTANSVSLYVDGVLVIAPAATASGNELVEYSGTIQFPKASAWYTIEMKYAVPAGTDVRGFKLSWANDGYSLSAFADTFVPPMWNETVPKQVVPSTRLTRTITQQFVADKQATLASTDAKVIDGTSGVSRDDYFIWNAMSLWSKTNDCEGSTTQSIVAANDVCFGCATSANITYIDQTRYRKCRGQGYQANDLLRVDVKPAIACSSQSVVQVDTSCPWCLSVTTAGVARSFQLTVRDAYGNIRDSATQALVSRLTSQTGLEKPFVGGVSFYASGSGPRAVTATDPQGRYMVSYTITRSGSFNNDVSLADVRGNGMYGTYFVNVDLTGGSVTQLDANINFNWGVAAPLASGVIPANYFSVRWTGLIRPVFSELYTFYVLADEVVRVYVDNTLIIDRWNSTSGVEYAGTYLMVGNVIFDIKVEYADFDNAAYVTLSYSSPSTPKDVIPNSVLFPALDLLSSSAYGGGRNTLVSWPAVTCATTSTVNGAGLTIATAGIPAYFTIQSYDQYGNPRLNQDSQGVAGTTSTADCKTTVLCNWRVRVVPDTVSAAFRSFIGTVNFHTDSSNPFFTVGYTYTIAGAHTVSTSYLKSTQIYSASPATGAGLAATYYDDILFSIPTAAITEVTVALTGTVAADAVPASSGLKADNLWSARYAGHILATSSPLSFSFAKTATESVKLWVDDVLMFSDTTNAAVGTTFAVTATNMYPIRIEFITVSGGTHTLSLALSGGTTLFPSWDVSGSTKRLRINPAVASSTRSSFRGRGLTLATSGVQALFTVSCRDEFDNLRAIGGDLFVARAFPAIPTASYGVAYAPSFYATVWGATQGGDFGALFQTGCSGCPALVRASVTDVKDNTYTVAFTPTKKGIYKVVSSLARIGSLSASYYAAAQTTTILNGLWGGAVGCSVDFSTSDYNIATTQTQPGAMTTNFAFIRWQGFIQPSKAAQYTFSVLLQASGVAGETATLWIDNTKVLSVTGALSGTALQATFGFGLANALYDIHVTFNSRPAAATASGVSLYWESLGSFAASDNVIKAIVPTSRLYTRQDVGNFNALNPTNTAALISEPNGAVGVTGTGTSAVVAAYSTNTPSIALTVHASIGCATKSVSTGNYLSLATAGGVAAFTISGRDSYQNDRTINSDMPFTVSLYGSGGSPTIQALMTRDTTAGSNKYTSQFTANVALSYDVFVKYANDNVFGSPYALVVKPGQECATKTTITGSGLTAATVNSQAAFTIQSRDSFGNARTQALSNSNPSFLCAPTISAFTFTGTPGTLTTCTVSVLTNCDGVPLLILGGVVTAGASPAVAILSTTTPFCNILNPGSYSTNPTGAIVQTSAFVTRISYTSNGPIHEIGNPANAINANTVAQPKVLNSLVTYSSSATAGMQASAGMYTGIYTLTSAPVAQASYFIPTMGVKGTLVATYYLGTITSPDSTTDLDTLTAGATPSLSVCFSGMVAFSTTYTYALPPGCGTAPTAVRFAGLVQTTTTAAIVFTVGRASACIARVFFRGQLLNTLVPPVSATGDIVGTTTTAQSSYDGTISNPAMDDFFIEVIGKGDGTLTITGGSLAAVWGNNYLSQPVFSQTITT